LRAPLDFTAFRCAGLIVAKGGDPYRVEPLRKCEKDALSHVGRGLPPHLVVPAPLPPYALLPLGAFGPLTPPLPSAIWAILLFIAFVVTCRLVSGLMRGPPALAVVALLFADLLASLLIGQVMPLEIAFLAFAGYALHRGRHVGAAVGAGLSMFQPQLGIPVIVGSRFGIGGRAGRWRPRSPSYSPFRSVRRGSAWISSTSAKSSRLRLEPRDWIARCSSVSARNWRHSAGSRRLRFWLEWPRTSRW
jgi:hypothetical protein